VARSLPSPLVADPKGNLLAEAVQRNFDDLADAFPLRPTATNFAQAPQARVTRASAQSIPTSTLTAVSFDTERYDRGTKDGMFDAVAPTRLTCRVSGLYAIAGAVEWPANATGYRRILLRVGGLTVIAEDLVPVNSASVVTRHNVASEYRLAGGDYVELLCEQNSGGALNVNAANDYTPVLLASWRSP
jgi:hypothetical protein